MAYIAGLAVSRCQTCKSRFMTVVLDGLCCAENNGQQEEKAEEEAKRTKTH